MHYDRLAMPYRTARDRFDSISSKLNFFPSIGRADGETNDYKICFSVIIIQAIRLEFQRFLHRIVRDNRRDSTKECEEPKTPLDLLRERVRANFIEECVVAIPDATDGYFAYIVASYE